MLFDELTKMKSEAENGKKLRKYLSAHSSWPNVLVIISAQLQFYASDHFK